MAKMVEAKSLYSQVASEDSQVDEGELIEQITIFLDMIDMIDSTMKEFKAKFMQLKDLRISDLNRQRSKIESEIQNSQQKAKKEDSDGERKKKLDDDTESEEEDAQPNDQPKTEDKNESKEEQKQPEVPAKPFGLKAPPKNTSHVLQNVRSLNSKLRAEQEGSEKKEEDLMEILMGLDLSGKPKPQDKDDLI